MNYQAIEKKYDDFILTIKKKFVEDKNLVLFNKRNIIKLIDYEKHKYVVKSFKIPHFINKIVYNFFRESKAKRSYENSVKLLELSINTPKPIGYIEYNSTFLFKDSYYVSEFFDYDFEIREVFTNKAFANRKLILKKFIDFSFDLHNKGVYHKDYSPGNILVKKLGDDAYIFSIIDVNRMQFLDFDVALRVKSLSRLTNDESDNKLMMKYYADISSFDENQLMQKFEIALQEEKRYLENKKKLKKLKQKKVA